MKYLLGARGKRKRDDKVPEKIQKVTENGNAPSPRKNMVSFGNSSTKSQIEKVDDSTENQRYLSFLFKSNEETGINYLNASMSKYISFYIANE